MTYYIQVGHYEQNPELAPQSLFEMFKAGVLPNPPTKAINSLVRLAGFEDGLADEEIAINGKHVARLISGSTMELWFQKST